MDIRSEVLTHEVADSLSGGARVDICRWRSSKQHRINIRAPPYMAFLPLSLSLSSTIPSTTSMSSPYRPSTSNKTGTMASVFLPQPLTGFRRIHCPELKLGSRRPLVVGMAPEEEKMTRRSPLDFPIEWDRPKPGRRPDIFPQFSPMKTPLPTPMPADPPEEDEEEEEEKKEEEEEDPDKENPEEPLT